MTRTSDPKQAARYIYRMVQADMTHGIYDDAGSLRSFSDLHDYCDANDYLDLATPLGTETDVELIAAVCEQFDALLAANPLTF